MAKALNFLSLAVFFFTVCSSNPELETLLSFKSSLQNPKSLSSWNESLPFCNWVGITCRLGRVSSLELTSASLSGEIPPQLGELTHLRTLKLGLNSLTGNLPPEIGNLTSLVTLDLSGNGLEGKLPVNLLLQGNMLDGEIPSSLANLTSLATLDLGSNQLTGSIPVEFGRCSNLQGLYLANNHLSGTVPANGSLDTWLRDGLNPKPLDWATRLKIAIGSARGLAFLHHGFTPHVIHRDVKSSNILLDPDFEAKVADFGLARLISAYETHVSTEIAGTLGYIPPEYGQSGRASVKGDVYSYGVILLELVTGKEPTGPEFKEGEGGNLVGWVLQKVKKGEGVDVVDQSVVNGGGRLGVMMMMKVLEVAVGCLAEKPNDRPSMRQVLEGLKGIRGW
ncbi:Leucine-rich repeat receptor protein kinase EMS1 [Linum perenne]